VSVDPLWEAFPAFNPYAYAGNSPLTHVDVDGRRIKFHSKNDEALFMEALTYLEKKGVKEAAFLRMLLEDEQYEIVLYTTHGSDPDAEFPHNAWDARNNILWWHPRAAFLYENADGKLERTSPAMSLLHEGVHAWLSKVLPSLQRALDVPDDDEEKWGTQEEKWVIERVETPAAIQAGEVTSGRTRHHAHSADRIRVGIPYPTTGPTTRDEANKDDATSDPQRKK